MPPAGTRARPTRPIARTHRLTRPRRYRGHGPTFPGRRAWPRPERTSASSRYQPGRPTARAWLFALGGREAEASFRASSASPLRPTGPWRRLGGSREPPRRDGRVRLRRPGEPNLPGRRRTRLIPERKGLLRRRGCLDRRARPMEGGQAPQARAALHRGRPSRPTRTGGTDSC